MNVKDRISSEAFHKRIKKTGAILKSKEMKFIKKDIDESLFFQRRTITLFDGAMRNKIKDLLSEFNKNKITIREPKCNFDVEMTMDMLDDVEKMTALLLFSGDSDMLKPLERLKIKGKRIGVVGVRGKVAEELHKIKDKYINFGEFYTGKKTYMKSENPVNDGTA